VLQCGNKEDQKPPAIEYPMVNQEGVARGKMMNVIVVENTCDDYYNSNNNQLTLPKAAFITPSYLEQRPIVKHNKLQQIQQNIFVNQIKDFWHGPPQLIATNIIHLAPHLNQQMHQLEDVIITSIRETGR
jgi:hypothetical protein